VWGRGGPRQLADGGTEPAAGADGGGGAPVRKRAQGVAVQLRGEVEKVVGGSIWALWGRSRASMHGWRLARVAGWGGKLRGLWWGFYGLKRDGGLGSSCWGGETRGKTGGAAASLAPAGTRRGASSARGREKLPRGGFLRGKSEIFWASRRFPVC
jgi:hypothetical protein